MDFTKTSLKQHLIIALTIGLILRLLCAHFNYGPFALDDYLHSLAPAKLLVDNNIHDLPNYRSWLIVWLLSAFLKVGEFLGATDTLAKIRVMLYGLAFFSLIGIYGTYLYVKNFGNKTFQVLTLYLIAAFPLVILVSTRAFGETLSMSIILLGLGITENARIRNSGLLPIIIGLVILGIASLLRFQVGLIWVSYVSCLIILNWRRFLLPIIIAGALTLIFEAGVDLLSNRDAFATFFNYLNVNEGGAASYGVTPWYSTWLLAFSFILAPFCLPLFRNYKQLLKSHWQIVVPLLVFITIHSMVPHKEERFLFPILGIELVILASIWSIEITRHSKLSKIFSWIFTLVSLPVLVFICFSNFQSGAVDPLFKTYADKYKTFVLYQDWNTYDDFYKITLSQGSQVKALDLLEIQQPIINNAINSGFYQVLIISANPDLLSQMQRISNFNSNGVSCSNINYASSLIDSLAYKLNPKHNKRRAPAMYVVCKHQ